MCQRPDCPNRGLLVVDANFVFFLVEGAIEYAQSAYPELTNTDRLPHIIATLDRLLGTFERCCSLDGELHISNMVFDELALADRKEINRMGLTKLKKFSNAERVQMLQVLRQHFPQPQVVSEMEVHVMRGYFQNQSVRPKDRDAALMVVVCRLATAGNPTLALSDDPDFKEPVFWLMQQESLRIGDELRFSPNRIMHRDYPGFIRRLHDCCLLSPADYGALAAAYHASLVVRLPGLKKQVVAKRDSDKLVRLFAIHTESVRLKGT